MHEKEQMKAQVDSVSFWHSLAPFSCEASSLYSSMIRPLLSSDYTDYWKKKNQALTSTFYKH